MSRKPFAFVTKQGGVVKADILERHALKENEFDSRQLDESSATFGGNNSFRQPPYNPDALLRLLEINTYHMRACRTKARDAAGLGFRFVEKKAEPNESEKDKATERIDSFTESLSRTLEKAQYDFEALGWAALELIRENSGDDLVIDVVHVPAQTVRLHVDGKRWVQQRGNKKVWFKVAGANTDKELNYKTGEWHDEGSISPQERATELLVWRNYAQRSPYYGMPDIIPAIGAVVGDVARRDYNISFFDNYGVPAYAVFITGDFDPGEPTNEEGNPDPMGMTDLERTVNEHFEDIVNNPHSVMVLSIPSAEEGEGTVEVELKALSVDTKEASFRLYRTDNRDEVLSAHGVDPYRVGIAETGSLGGSTANTATDIYKESVIEPRQTDLEDLFNKHVVSLEGWEFKLEELDTSDPAGDLGLLKDLFSMGAVTPKQIATHYADRFGLDIEAMDDIDALNGYYVAGVRVDVEEESEPEPAEPITEIETDASVNPEDEVDVIEADEVDAALQSMRDAVLMAARKSMGDDDELAKSLADVFGGVR